jgi:hypothetical protein
MSFSSNWLSKSSLGKLLFLCHINSMYMHTTLQKIGLQHKKWATLPCNHPIGNARLEIKG